MTTKEIQAQLNNEINSLQALTLKREIALRNFKKAAYTVLLLIVTVSTILGCCGLV